MQIFKQLRIQQDFIIAPFRVRNSLHNLIESKASTVKELAAPQAILKPGYKIKTP